MLARLEATYLNVLRVIILVAATLALLVTAFAIVSSAPYFIGQLGLSSDAEGGDLAQFVEEQRPYEDVSASGGDSDTATRTFTISASLQGSAKRFTAYANKHHSAGIKVSDVEKALAASQEQFSLQYYDDYEDSIERLTSQLEASEGAPLSLDMLDELMRWHDQSFQTALAEQEAAKGEEMMSALTAFGTAGGAFIVFVFLVFCFLFVRIERNLRIVHVANAKPHEVADDE